MNRLILGLTGPTRAGKGTVARYLVACHGFVRLAFMDALHIEICDTWHVTMDVITVHHHRASPYAALCLQRCSEPGFIDWYQTSARWQEELALYHNRASVLDLPRTPRWIVERWSEWRRSESATYLIERLQNEIDVREQQHIVISSVQRLSGQDFAAEAQFIHRQPGAELWQITRPGLPANVDFHQRPLPSDVVDRYLSNDGSIETLQQLTKIHLDEWLQQTRNADSALLSAANKEGAP